MPIFAQAIPGESVVNDTVNGAWENLPPEAAALFIVLILLLVGGMFLSYTYMKTYGARVQEKKDEKVAAAPEPYRPGAKTLTGLLGLTGKDVRELALRDEPSKPAVDAAQEVKLDSLKEKFDRIEKEVDNLRKWKERKTKQWIEDNAVRQKEERLRTGDLMRMSNRITALETKQGMKPGGSGVTLFSAGGDAGSTIPPVADDRDDETLG
jgi:hypothetical protein